MNRMSIFEPLSICLTIYDFRISKQVPSILIKDLSKKGTKTSAAFNESNVSNKLDYIQQREMIV